MFVSCLAYFFSLTHVTFNQISNTDFPGHYPGEDHSWNFDWFSRVLLFHVAWSSGLANRLSFSQNLVVKVHRLSGRSCEFDIVGVDASIANALRRCIMAEVRFRFICGLIAPLSELRPD